MGTYIFICILGIIFRVQTQMTGATLEIGRILADTKTGQGHQSAISPPGRSFWVIATWVIVFYVFVTTGIEGGVGGVFILLGLFLGSCVLTSTFLPEPTSSYYCQKIFHSMSNRYADYLKENDLERAEAMKYFMALFVEKLGSQLVKNNSAKENNCEEV